MTPEELRSVGLFIGQVEKLEGSRLNQSVLSKPAIHTTITTKNKSAVAAIAGLDEEALEAFLLRFRTLIRDTDKMSLRTIGGLFEGGRFSEASRLKFNQQRFFLTDWLKQISAIQFPEDTELTNEAILDTFIFGEYAHKSPGLVERLKNWKTNEPHFTHLKASFILSLKVALASLSEIRRILESELNE